MKRDDTDFHRIDPRHYVIHDRLLNWARCVQVHSTSGSKCAPMFRHYRSSEVWQEPTALAPIDTIGGWKMEKMVRELPEKNTDAVRWHYIYYRVPVGKVCRLLGVSASGLAELVTDGRTMLANRA